MSSRTSSRVASGLTKDSRGENVTSVILKGAGFRGIVNNTLPPKRKYKEHEQFQAGGRCRDRLDTSVVRSRSCAARGQAPASLSRSSATETGRGFTRSDARGQSRGITGCKTRNLGEGAILSGVRDSAVCFADTAL